MLFTKQNDVFSKNENHFTMQGAWYACWAIAAGCCLGVGWARTSDANLCNFETLIVAKMYGHEWISDASLCKFAAD